MSGRVPNLWALLDLSAIVRTLIRRHLSHIGSGGGSCHFVSDVSGAYIKKITIPYISNDNFSQDDIFQY